MTEEERAEKRCWFQSLEWREAQWRHAERQRRQAERHERRKLNLRKKLRPVFDRLRQERDAQ
jgi:hypothetical protein